MKRVIPFFLLIVFLVSFTSAAVPSFVVGDFAGGLTIQINILATLQENKTFMTNFHVYNTSNGYLLANDTVDCEVHIYNSSGGHIVHEDMMYDVDDGDFYINILGGNLTKGIYSYIGTCNSSTQGGFVSGNFQVTNSGFGIEEGNSNIINTSLYFFIILSILSFLAFFFSDGEKIQVKWTLFIIGGVFALIAINLLSLAISDSLINQNVVGFFDSITAISFILFYGAAFLLIVLWILAFFNTLFSKRRTINESKFGGNF